jgi:chromosome segregation ATPase
MESCSNTDLDLDGDIVLVTPYQKLMLLKSDLQPLNIDLRSDGGNSFMSSTKEDCESPLSSWDSEPETDILVINCHSMQPEEHFEVMKLEDNYVDMGEQNQFVGVENTDDSLLWEMDNKSYDDLLKKLREKDEELRVTNLKLQLSEEVNIKLEVQVENNEGQLENVSKELKLKEEELSVADMKLQLLEEEIIKLKVQVENSKDQVDNVSKELKLKEEELSKQKNLFAYEKNQQKELLEEEIFKLKIQIERSEFQLDNVWKELNLKEEELQKHTAESDTRIQEYVNKITNLVEQFQVDNEKQFQVANENLKQLEDEIEMLKKELSNKASETHQLQGQLKVTQENMDKSELELVSGRKQIHMLGELVRMHRKEVQKLKSEMLISQDKFSSEKDELQFNIDSLLSTKIQLTSKLEDCESRNKELENKLRQHEAEILKQEELLATRQMVLQDEISSVREELGQRMHDVEAVNKELNMVVIERDEANVEINKLLTEICSCGDQISNMTRYIMELKVSLKEVGVDKKATLNEVNKLKLRVGELEKEVVILDMAEEKEAIRQLCCSLEHYKNGYLELLQATYG